MFLSFFGFLKTINLTEKYLKKTKYFHLNLNKNIEPEIKIIVLRDLLNPFFSNNNNSLNSFENIIEESINFSINSIIYPIFYILVAYVTILIVNNIKNISKNDIVFSEKIPEKPIIIRTFNFNEIDFFFKNHFRNNDLFFSNFFWNELKNLEIPLILEKNFNFFYLKVGSEIDIIKTYKFNNIKKNFKSLINDENWY